MAPRRPGLLKSPRSSLRTALRLYNQLCRWHVGPLLRRDVYAGGITERSGRPRRRCRFVEAMTFGHQQPKIARHAVTNPGPRPPGHGGFRDGAIHRRLPARGRRCTLWARPCHVQTTVSALGGKHLLQQWPHLRLTGPRPRSQQPKSKQCLGAMAKRVGSARREDKAARRYGWPPVTREMVRSRRSQTALLGYQIPPEL
jgi:hypothetical protein